MRPLISDGETVPQGQRKVQARLLFYDSLTATHAVQEPYQTLMDFRILPVFLLLRATSFSYAETVSGEFMSRGVKIHFAIEGKGEPVVLIHGWMGDSTMWGKDSAGNVKLEPLEGFQLIAIDCRGHGKSGKPRGQKAYGREMAEDVVRLLNHLKLKKAHIIGYSMGAFIAGKVAAEHPARVLSVIYGGQAPLLTGESGSKEIETFAKAVQEGKGLGSYILEVSPADKPKPTQKQAEAIAQFLFGGKDVQAFADSGLSFNKLEVPLKSLQKCKSDCLFIYGSKESDRLKARVDFLRSHLGRGNLQVVKDGDHMTTLTKPQFGLAIADFLRSHKTK